MKYLKVYEEFDDSVNGIVKNIKDILLDFTDVGNVVSVSSLQNLTPIEISIRNNTKQLDKEPFITLFNYMKRLEYECFCISLNTTYSNAGVVKAYDSPVEKIYIDDDNIEDTFDRIIDKINKYSVIDMIFWNSVLNEY